MEPTLPPLILPGKLQHFLLAGGAAKLCENCVSRVAKGLNMDLAAAQPLCLVAGGCFRKFGKLV